MRLGLVFAGEHGGRHQGRRELHRFHRAFARQVAVERFQLQRARRQQHAALAAPGRLVDQAGGEIVLQDRQRAAPVALGAAESEHRLRGPGRGGRELQRLFRDHHGGDRIVGALRLDEQAAQAEQPCVLALGHGVERGPGAGAVAAELGGLRVQQQRQRIVAGVFARDISMGAGGGGIAMADREQAVGDGVAAAGVTPLTARAADLFRRAPQRAQQAPHQDGGDDDDAEQQHEFRQRGVGAPAVPTSAGIRRSGRPPRPRPRMRARPTAETE